LVQDAGVEVDPMGDLNTEAERKLGQLVLEKYGIEFYILHRYPLAVRPFYTMPCHDNPAYSNSFDVFIRGEEIISGAQHDHRPELLEKRAQACGIELKTISTYIDAIRNGVTLHGGFGAGLERVIMLFLGLDNIHKTSLFPRDPHFVKLLMRDDIETSSCSSWCGFPFYAADFGWGKPSWVNQSSEAKNLIVLIDSRDGDGIEASLTFKEEDMAIMESNNELFAYASLDPPLKKTP
ncbi:unnamed protein product, partial [Prunus brigantina]